MYTFSMKWRINDVPITCYLMTHAYFIFYHSMTNLILRRLRRSLAAFPPAASSAISALVVFALAYVTAFMETFTISNFPYYSFENRQFAYTTGSAFYAIYFIVSFPMFLRIDEQPGSHRCARVPLSSLGI
jgi:cycloeucalenol cycloisomerase